MELRDFEGVWLMDADASAYGERALPGRGVYTIRIIGDHLDFAAEWIAEAASQSMRFQATPGQVQPLEGGAELLTRLDGDALITEVRKDGQALHTASRRLVDGTLVVEQVMAGEAPFTAVYRKSRIKQVICYRRDLQMRKGKIAAQVAHASLGVFTRRGRVGDALTVPVDGPMSWWLTRGSAKVVLSVAGEPELLEIARLADEAGLPSCLITDAGKTEFHGVPTRTTVAIGPAPSEWLDAITGPEGVVDTKLA